MDIRSRGVHTSLVKVVSEMSMSIKRCSRIYIHICVSQPREYCVPKIHLRMVYYSFAFHTWISHLQTRSVVRTADMLNAAFNMQVGWSYT